MSAREYLSSHRQSTISNARRATRPVLSEELESSPRRGKPLGFWIFILLISALALTRLTVAGLVEVDGQSMRPAIAAGSTCLVLKIGTLEIFGLRLTERSLRVDDLVVAKVAQSHQSEAMQVIKRVRALQGQMLEPSSWLQRSQLTKAANGKHTGIPGVSCSAAGCRVKPKHVFLMSDERLGSVDSRHFGAVPTKDIIGRISACF